MDYLTYWRTRARKRKKQIIKNIKGLKELQTLLYIGANPNRIEIVDLFYDWGYEITVLEAWRSNAEALIKLNKKYCLFKDIICGDILDEEIWGNGFGCFPGLFDVVMFWHGPEHVDKESLPELLRIMEVLARKVVILACPIGKYEQGEVHENPYELHASYLWPEDFEQYGYKTDSFVRKKGMARFSNLVAWKYIESC